MVRPLATSVRPQPAWMVTSPLPSGASASGTRGLCIQRRGASARRRSPEPSVCPPCPRCERRRAGSPVETRDAPEKGDSGARGAMRSGTLGLEPAGANRLSASTWRTTGRPCPSEFAASVHSRRSVTSDQPTVGGVTGTGPCAHPRNSSTSETVTAGASSPGFDTDAPNCRAKAGNPRTRPAVR